MAVKLRSYQQWVSLTFRLFWLEFLSISSLFLGCLSLVELTERAPHNLLNGDEGSAWVQLVDNRRFKPLGHSNAHSIDVIDLPSACNPQCPVGGREFVTLLWQMAGGITLNSYMGQCTHKHTLKWPNWDKNSSALTKVQTSNSSFTSSIASRGNETSVSTASFLSCSLPARPLFHFPSSPAAARGL